MHNYFMDLWSYKMKTNCYVSINQSKTCLCMFPILLHSSRGIIAVDSSSVQPPPFEIKPTKLNTISDAWNSVERANVGAPCNCHLRYLFATNPHHRPAWRSPRSWNAHHFFSCCHKSWWDRTPDSLLPLLTASLPFLKLKHRSPNYRQQYAEVRRCSLGRAFAKPRARF